MEKETIKKLYELVCESRFFQEKLWEHDLCGYCDIGEEAITIGSLSALREDDVVSTYFRGDAAMLRYKGVVSLQDEMCWWTGHKGEGNPYTNVLPSLWTDPEHGVIGPASSCLGGDVDLCCGVGLALKYKKTDRLIMLYVGDGATSKGNFHESLTFASLMKLPMIFMIRSNGWAMSTPTEKGIAWTDFGKVAEAYNVGFKGVDGNDATAVREAALEAAEYVRSGKGPYIVQCETYRMSPHSSHDADLYRSREVWEEWKKKDPILRLEGYMTQAGYTEEETSAVKAEVKQRIEDAYDYAMTQPKIDINVIRENHVQVVKNMWGVA